MSPSRCFSAPPPQVDLDRLTGTLMVVEGPDSSGRSTHIRQLTHWLEQHGYAVTQVGIRQSVLVSPELERAKRGNVLNPRTMSLFYAADFYDQMENIMLPALRSGAIVLADRYVFSLMVRDLVRGADARWVESLYSRALAPDVVFYLRAPVQVLAVRTLADHGRLDYWESGMDMALSRDPYECFLKYQRRILDTFNALGKQHEFQMINANRSVKAVQRDLRARMASYLPDLSGE